MKFFEQEIAELLEVDSVSEYDIIEDFKAWDSLTSLSIIAFIAERYNVSISAKDILNARTIIGLKNFVFSKSNKGNEM